MADLQELASRLLTTGPHKIEGTSRRVRALFDGKYIFNTTSAKYVWEHPNYPYFYIPMTSISPDVKLTKLKTINDPSPSTNENTVSTFQASIRVKEKETNRVLVFEKTGDGSGGSLEGLVRFEHTALDAWFEEDLEIYGNHPRSPYARIDILPTSRRVEVKVGGVMVADTAVGGGAKFLFETGLRARYYLPKTSVKWEYVTPSETTTKCPYKGRALYYNLTVEEKEIKDAIWWYEYSILESAGIGGMVCFYNEKVDTYIDGVLEEK